MKLNKNVWILSNDSHSCFKAVFTICFSSSQLCLLEEFRWNNCHAAVLSPAIVYEQNENCSLQNGAQKQTGLNIYLFNIDFI